MLEINDIHTYYGESYVIQGLSFELEKGEVSSLLGRNGAGKTTTLMSITGINPPRRGRILYENRDITGFKPYEVARLGIALVPEDRRIFSTLRVEENLSIAIRNSKQRKKSLDEIYRQFPILGKRRHHRGNQLSGGEQQILAIARALMTGPNLLLLDEPTEGLAPIIVEQITDTILDLRKRGITILLVEQNFEMTLRAASWHYVIDNGRIIYTGSNEDLIANDELRNKYLSI